jgi:hypothetical protein
MKIAFDVISDLNLSSDEALDWTNKPTSLYCVIAGNISSDVRVIKQTLLHLSRMYHGVFYISGNLEHDNLYKVRQKHTELSKICSGIKRVAYLHNYVVIIDGVAVVAVSGYQPTKKSDLVEEVISDKYNAQDIEYLNMTLERLQLHLDVKKIMVITHSVPNHELYFGEHPEGCENNVPLTSVLGQDNEQKVSHWIYGDYPKTVDAMKYGINFVNNGYFKRNPYYPKRIEVEI